MCFVCILESSIFIFLFLLLDFGFIAYFTIQVVIGVLLNYSLFWCTASNSALTTSLVGVLKSILQTAIGFFTFGGVKFNAINISGIGFNVLGGIMYTYAKHTEKFKTNIQSYVKSIQNFYYKINKKFQMSFYIILNVIFISSFTTFQHDFNLTEKLQALSEG